MSQFWLLFLAVEELRSLFPLSMAPCGQWRNKSHWKFYVWFVRTLYINNVQNMYRLPIWFSLFQIFSFIHLPFGIFLSHSFLLLFRFILLFLLLSPPPSLSHPHSFFYILYFIFYFSPFMTPFLFSSFLHFFQQTK